MALSLTSGVELKTRNKRTRGRISGVAATIYAGSTLSVLAAGGVTNLPFDVSQFAGFADETKTVAIGDDISTIYEGDVFIPNTNAALTDEGLLLYVDRSAANDDPRLLVISPESAHDYPAGRVTRVEVGIGWWIDVADRGVSQVAP